MEVDNSVEDVASQSRSGSELELDEAEIMDLEEQPESKCEGEEIEGSAAISFCPPVYVQRYCRVSEVLEDLLASPKYKEVNAGVGKTVMEVGCAEFGMMKHYKTILDIGKVIFLDLDRQLLEDKIQNMKPLPADYIRKVTRPQPMIVEAYSGCITTVDANVHQDNPDIWAIVGIEIIEHLYPDVLRGFEETVFGIFSPQIVILTTPNSEFNELFNLPPGKFRHWDHKFEWTRNEFDSWCKKIVAEFPCYSYKTEGICEGSEETKHLGCVSQMVIFEKRECQLNAKPCNQSSVLQRIHGGAYSLVRRMEYPNYIETRTPEEIALMEFNFYVDNFLFTRSMLNEYDDLEVKEVKLPISRILSLPEMPAIAKENPDFLKNVLITAGHQVRMEDSEWTVVFDVAKYVADNLESSSSDSESYNDEEKYLSKDMNRLDMEQLPEEMWE